MQRVIGVLLALAMLVVVAGCGEAAEPQVESDPDAQVEREELQDDVEDGGAESQDEDSVNGGADPQDDPYAFSYQIGYEVCGADIDQLFDEAGTSDPQEASEWYGEGLTSGPHREGGIAGCRDAVLGSDPEY